jgi:aminoglycoside phosphotransferase (APT) family kinase protein
MNNTAPVADENTSASYLLNVVAALRDRILPELSGGASDRLQECMTIIARVVHQLQAEHAPPAEAMADNVALLEGARQDLAEESFELLQAGLKNQLPGEDSRTFNQDNLERFLRQHKLGGPATRVTKAVVLAGGRSKQTVLVEQDGAAGLPAQLVIRQDWSSAVTGTSVVTEFELLSRIALAGLKVPQPLILEPGSAALGSPFLVMQRMPGKQLGDIFHPVPSENLAFDLARQLGRLHSLPVEAFDALGVPTMAFSHEQLRADLAGFREIHATIGSNSRTVAIALDWLEANINTVDGARSLVHNDLGCHNFLIESEALTAVLDWELAHIGNPAADLGYIRDFVAKMTSWDRFMAVYAQAGGPKISAATIDFYTLWCGVRLFSLLMRARAGVVMGLVKDTEITYACAHFIPQQHHLITRALRRVLALSSSPQLCFKTS